MCKHCGCYCCEPEEMVTDIDMVEDGDALQEYGVNRTLQLLRTMMNQGGQPIVDQPPPAYKDFAKYPLATESDDKPTLLQSTGLAWYPTVVPVQQSANTSSSHPQSWTEPFPKPPGEPPPVPQHWFFTRLASIRRSLLSHFSPSRTTSTVIRDSTPSPMTPPVSTSGPTTDNLDSHRCETSRCVTEPHLQDSSSVEHCNRQSTPTSPTHNQNYNLPCDAVPQVRTIHFPQQIQPPPAVVNLRNTRSFEEFNSPNDSFRGAEPEP